MRVFWNETLKLLADWLLSKQVDTPYVYTKNSLDPLIERRYYKVSTGGQVTCYSFHAEFGKWMWYQCFERYREQAVKGLKPITRAQFKEETGKDWVKTQGEYRTIY